MKEDDIKLIKRTWKLFREINPAVVGDTFYSRLFIKNPSLRKIFPREMNLQYQKLMDMLSTIVSRLDNIEMLSADIAAMGARHRGYGVKPAQYQLVEDALLWTLEQGLGADFNADVKNAWTNCYRQLYRQMTEKVGE